MPYKLSNTRLTGKGLFELLSNFPDAVHFLEDVEPLFKDKNAMCVLRSALWGQANEHGQRESLVTWGIAGKRREFIFTGGIIMVSNCPLDDVS